MVTIRGDIFQKHRTLRVLLPGYWVIFVRQLAGSTILSVCFDMLVILGYRICKASTNCFRQHRTQLFSLTVTISVVIRIEPHSGKRIRRLRIMGTSTIQVVSLMYRVDPKSPNKRLRQAAAVSTRWWVSMWQTFSTKYKPRALWRHHRRECGHPTK